MLSPSRCHKCQQGNLCTQLPKMLGLPIFRTCPKGSYWDMPQLKWSAQSSSQMSQLHRY